MDENIKTSETPIEKEIEIKLEETSDENNTEINNENPDLKADSQ